MLGIISFLCAGATIAVFGYYVSRWTTFDNIMQPALYDFEKRNKTFYNSFWIFYPKIKRKCRKNLSKFMLYFLAQRGYIDIDVDSNSVVRIVKNQVSYERVSTAERYLLGILFGNTDLIEYTDENAIIGKEAVDLSKISDYYNRMVVTCPFDESVKAPVATSDGEKAIDYVTIRKEAKIYKYCIIAMIFFAYLPSAVYEGLNSSLFPIIISYYGIITVIMLFLSCALNNLAELMGVKANVTPPQKNDASPSDTEDAVDKEVVYEEVVGDYIRFGNASIPAPKNLPSLLRFISLKTLHTVLKENNHELLSFMVGAVRFFLWLGIGFFSILLLGAFLSVTGSYEQQLVSILGSLLVVIAWLVKCIRRSNKEKFFAMRKKSNKSYMKFFKKAFTPKMLSMYSDKPKNLSYLIPYSALFGKSKELNAVLPASPDSIPKWVTQTGDMSFEQIDHLVDNSLYNQPQLKK